MKEVKIGHRLVGASHPPFVIAELSGNHGQSYDKAIELVDLAADSGAHAIKLQTYTPDTITLNIHEGEFFISDPNSLWKGISLYSLYAKAMTPWEWHKDIFEHAKSKGLIAFSSPFDLTAVEFLESLDVPCYKIASFENTDHGLLEAVAKTGKPVSLSTGMASQSELAESVEVLRKNGCSELVLLKCTSNYPARPLDANIRTIPHLAELFNCPAGLSDHTEGIGVAVASVALGASVIEKHFVSNRSEGGVDAEFSLEPFELKMLVDEARRAYDALGEVFYGCTDKEIVSRKDRRSLYISKDIKAGEILTKENLRSVRPGLGLPTKYLPLLLGRKILKDVKAGTAMCWELV